MIPQSIENSFIEKYLEITGHKLVIENTSGLSGGSINNTAKLKTSEGDFFIKWNSSESFPDMFKSEAKGLGLLADTKTILIPGVILQGSAGGCDYLVLEYIKKGNPKNGFWKKFAFDLASLHSVNEEYYGLEHNNYIGSLRQYNDKKNDWISFFIEQRLEIQLRIARDNRKVDSSDIRKFGNLFNRLPEIFPVIKASLIHGDLWCGNFLATETGTACIFDPAVYYGNREMDLAMSKLFGGFSNEFYEEYNNIYPLEKAWEKRTDICNLYPLMVHVNLFGGSYINEVRGIIGKF